MDLLRAIPSPYRAALVAAGLSGAIHGVALVTWHPFLGEDVNLEPAAYAARLEPAAAPVAQPPPPQPRPKPRPKPEPQREETVAFLPDAVEPPPAVAEAPSATEPEAVAPEAGPPETPEVVALARTCVGETKNPGLSTGPPVSRRAPSASPFSR